MFILFLMPLFFINKTDAMLKIASITQGTKQNYISSIKATTQSNIAFLHGSSKSKNSNSSSRNTAQFYKSPLKSHNILYYQKMLQDKKRENLILYARNLAAVGGVGLSITAGLYTFGSALNTLTDLVYSTPNIYWLAANSALSPISFKLAYDLSNTHAPINKQIEENKKEIESYKKEIDVLIKAEEKSK
jgi:hypothetical protein